MRANRWARLDAGLRASGAVRVTSECYVLAKPHRMRRVFWLLEGGALLTGPFRDRAVGVSDATLRRLIEKGELALAAEDADLPAGCNAG